MRQATTASATVDGTVLTISVPDGAQASPIPGGLMIASPDAATRRRANEMTVTLGGGAGSQGSGVMPPLDGTRGSGAGAIRYRVTRGDGGSGGQEVTLMAQRPCGTKVVHLRFDAQGEEAAEIDLEPAFALLESARCSPAI